MYVSITNTEGVMAILMISRSRGGHIGIMFWKVLGALVPLAPLAMPMAIESKCMSLTVSGIPTENEAWLAWVMVASRSFAVVCRCVPANCDILQAKTFLFIVSPGIKLQEESVYSKADVICL